MTSDRLMTAEDLAGATGFVRYSKQVEWFRRELGIKVARRADGSPVISWETFTAVQNKRAGIISGQIEEQRPLLRSEKLRAVK